MQDRNNGTTKRSRKGAAVKTGLMAVGLMSALGTLGAGCLSRPVQPGEPTTKTNFTAVVKQQGIDKVDILFAIDNSASMGDKQALLALAVPDLVNRLINPYCIEEGTGNNLGASDNGACNAGKVEFPPIHDMHIGIISSALGAAGADQCNPAALNPVNAGLNAHNDDRGHLLNRGGASEAPVAAAGTSNFLAWLPAVTANDGKPDPNGVTKITDVNQFKTDFADLVTGVHEYGCGFEAQLESVYRFLNQPDPYDQVVSAGGSRKALQGVDTQLLQQRADFLRPDSLVAVIMITDENDSTVDPLSINGQGWAYLNSSFPGSGTGTAARGTSACDTDLKSGDCTSCGFKKNADGSENTKVTQDPNCQTNGGYYGADDDNLNVRPIRMKARFGVDPQFPISRYVKGFQSTSVPNRNGEHPPTASGSPSPNYVGNADCTNPLFAAQLPTSFDADPTTNIDTTLCKLPRGPRTPDLVFFAVIGGVPWQLLAQDPNAADIVLKDKFTDADWTKVIGKDPVNYDTSGIDPHMIESFTPRASLPPATAANDADPYNGREWDTAKKDLEFACTFPLPNGSKDCKLPEFKNACDCDGNKNPPLCDGPSSTTQVRGKAYPTIREFSVVRALGDQGIISSICPIKVVDNADKTDPLYGYRPAVKTIVDRLKNALSIQCLPQALAPDAAGEVPCLILETLGTDGPETNCNDATTFPGRSIPEATILSKVRETQAAESGGDAGGDDLTKRPVCKLKQIVVKPGDTCKDSPDAGWCYVTNADGKTPSGACQQAILFTESASRAQGSRFSLQCIRSSEGTATVSTGDAGK